jgi:hypothetical protein
VLWGWTSAGARPKALGIEPRKHPPEGIMRGHAMQQGEKRLQPCLFALAKEFHVLESFPTSEERVYGNDQNIRQVMLLCPLNAWVL